MTSPSSVATGGGARPLDIAVTVVELVLLAGLALFATVGGLMLAMASDSCGSVGECDTGLIGLAVLAGAAAPWLALLPVAVWAIVRMARGRSSWWVPLVAVPVWALLFAGAVALASAGAA